MGMPYLQEKSAAVLERLTYLLAYCYLLEVPTKFSQERIRSTLTNMRMEAVR